MGSAVKPVRLLLLALALPAGCGRPADTTTAGKILEGLALEKRGDVAELEGVTIDRFENDHLRYRAVVATAELDRARGVAEGTKVKAEQRDEGRGPKASVSADRGRTVIATKKVELTGHVVAKDREGRVLGAETLTYDFEADLVDAKGKVTLDGKNFHAEGDGLQLDRRAGTAEVGGPTAARVRPKRR